MANANFRVLQILATACAISIGYSSRRLAADQPLSISAIREAVSGLLKAESRSSTSSEQAKLTREMAALYSEISGDARIGCDPLLLGQKNKLWTRLTTIKSELQRRQSIALRKRSTTNENRWEQSTGEVQLIANCLSFAPSSLEPGGGGPIAGDYATELIDLIQATIEPDHWNINGGPGAIIYYRPAMALVVRGRSEVQGKVGDTLEGVRAAGK